MTDQDSPQTALAPWRQLGTRWRHELSPALRDHLIAMASPDEVTLAVQEVSRAEGRQLKPGLLWVTHRRACLLAYEPRGSGVQLQVVAELGPQRPVTVVTGFGRADRFEQEGQALWYGPRVGGGQLRRLAALIAAAPLERVLSVAEDELQERRFPVASDLLALALELSLSAEEEEEAAAAPPPCASSDALTLAQRVRWRRAQVALELGLFAQVISELAALKAMRPADDLLKSAPSPRPDPELWWMALALAHEEAQDDASAAAVLGAIVARDPSRDLLQLQRARHWRRAGLLEQAAQGYEAFIQARVDANQGVTLVAPEALDHAASTDPDLDAPRAAWDQDPDLTAAHLELLELLVELGRHAQAARVAIDLIRQAPLWSLGYERLFALSEHLSDDALERDALRVALELARVMDPRLTQRLQRAWPLEPPGHWLDGQETLSEHEHEQQVRHPGERARAVIVQRWLGSLLQAPQDTRDIELHCQRLTPDTHPQLMQALAHMAKFLGVEAPRCALSHGLTGAQTLGQERSPLILLGAAHLTPAHPQALTLRQQVFALCAELEHIRAKHLILTRSELWGALRARSLDGAGAALSLLPVGALLGEATKRALAPLLQLMQRGQDKDMLKLIGGYLSKQLEQGAVQGQLQGAYEATLGRMVRRNTSPRAPESLLKEQLTEFARCAMYTSDRVGLLACDDLGEATRALLLLSPRTCALAPALDEGGLLRLLERRDERGQVLHAELQLRLAQLYHYALSPDYLKLRRRLHQPPQLMEQDPGSG